MYYRDGRKGGRGDMGQHRFLGRKRKESCAGSNLGEMEVAALIMQILPMQLMVQMRSQCTNDYANHSKSRL